MQGNAVMWWGTSSYHWNKFRQKGFANLLIMIFISGNLVTTMFHNIGKLVNSTFRRYQIHCHDYCCLSGRRDGTVHDYGHKSHVTKFNIVSANQMFATQIITTFTHSRCHFPAFTCQTYWIVRPTYKWWNASITNKKHILQKQNIHTKRILVWGVEPWKC